MESSTTESSESKFNTQKMSEISDNIIRTLLLCKENKEIYKNDKTAMLKTIKLNNPIFYEKYPRICRILVYEDDISPLLGMIQTFAKVQEGSLSFNKANDIIQGAINSKYVDPVINSDKLVRERQEKQEKTIDISKN